MDLLTRSVLAARQDEPFALVCLADLTGECRDEEVTLFIVTLYNLHHRRRLLKKHSLVTLNVRRVIPVWGSALDCGESLPG